MGFRNRPELGNEVNMSGLKENLLSLQGKSPIVKGVGILILLSILMFNSLVLVMVASFSLRIIWESWKFGWSVFGWF